MQNFIIDILQNTALQYPHKKAIVCTTKSVTFSQLDTQIKQYAFYLQKKGVNKDDRVLVFVPMKIDLYVSIMAVNYIGAVAVVLDEWVSLKRMEICCKMADCKVIITIPKAMVLFLFSSVLRKISLKISINYPKSISQLSSPISTKTTDTSLITFTTGSSGTPKAAKRTYGFLHEQLKALISEINPHINDNYLISLPIFTFMNLAIGTSTYLADFNQKKPEKLKVNLLLKMIINNKITSIICSPNLILKLAEYCLNNDINVPILEFIYTGGAAVFPSDAAKLKKAFPSTNTTILYGSTEAEPISSINVKELSTNNLEIKEGLDVGEIYKKCKVKIISILDKAIILDQNKTLHNYEVPFGKTGEIIVSGHHVLKEYFNDELFERNKIIDKDVIWHRTGDAGFIGKNGHLYLCGRAMSVIKKENSYISPFVVEAFLNQIEGINMGTVIEKDNQIMALIELDKKHDKKTILKQIKKTTVIFNSVKFIKKIPRDPRHYSKIDYEALKNMS